MNRIYRVAQLAAYAAPALVISYLVLTYGVNVPYWDEWELSEPLFRLANGEGLGWGELFAQHNEHRIVFPRLVLLALALATKWNSVAAMTASVAFAIGSLALLASLARPALSEVHPVGRIWAALLVSGMLFSITQWENWLWGWQVEWFMVVFATIATVVFARASLDSPRPWVLVAAAAASAIVSQYSLANGVLAWGCGALVLALHRRRWRILAVWIALATLSTAAYLAGYTRPAHHPSPLLAFEQPAVFLEFVGNFLSGPFGQRTAYGLAALGAFVLLSLLALIQHRTVPGLVVAWIAIGGFSVANAVLTGVGRVGFGPEQGLASRYITLSAPLAISLVALAALVLQPSPRRRWAGLRMSLAALAAAVMTTAVIRADQQSLVWLKTRGAQMAEAQRCVLLLERATDECLKQVYPHLLLLRHRILKLQAFGWSGFPSSAEQPPGTLRLVGSDGARLWKLRPEERTIGWIGPARWQDGTLTVQGWTLHPRGNTATVRRVVVASGNLAVGEAEIVEDRPDVAAFYKDPAATRTGWTLKVPDFPIDRMDRPLAGYLILADGVLVQMDGYAAIERR